MVRKYCKELRQRHQPLWSQGTPTSSLHGASTPDAADEQALSARSSVASLRTLSSGGGGGSLRSHALQASLPWASPSTLQPMVPREVVGCPSTAVSPSPAARTGGSDSGFGTLAGGPTHYACAATKNVGTVAAPGEGAGARDGVRRRRGPNPFSPAGR